MKITRENQGGDKLFLTSDKGGNTTMVFIVESDWETQLNNEKLSKLGGRTSVTLRTKYIFLARQGLCL